jgi:hypothetical protein
MSNTITAKANGLSAQGVAEDKRCWICRENDGTTGEHKIKKSDLRDVLGNPSQAAPFWYHKPDLTAKAVGSLKAGILKSAAPMCAHCNNARTQLHDRAWEEMSAWFTRRKAFRRGQAVRANRIWRYDTRKKMRDVHLFFLKALGCVIAEAKDNAPIDLEPFSAAIMNNRIHPEVYLQFCSGDGSVGRHFDCIQLDTGHVFAVLTYRIKFITVNALYAQAGGGWESLSRAWHPRFDTNKLVIADYAVGPKTEQQSASS